MDRRHELLREESAHRLTDEVRGRDPSDAEPIGGLGCDGRLPGPGRATDEHDHREVELLQLTEAPESADGLEAFGLPEHLDGELLDVLELDALLASDLQTLLDPLRELVGAAERHPDRDESARHQPLRVRLVRRAEG